MKAIWTAICVMALVNLVGFLGVLGWLKGTDRLSRERIQKVREVFTTTNAEDAAALAEAEAKKKVDDAKAAEEAKHQKAPLTAEQQLGFKSDLSEVERQKMKRLEREVADLSQSLAEARLNYTSTRDRLEKERQDVVAATETGALNPQFKKAIGVLEGMKAAEAKSVLQQILEGNTSALPGTLQTNSTAVATGAKEPSEQALRQVVSYLNAMQERPRIKVISEFQKENPHLAALLLEKLRSFGMPTVSAPKASGERTTASTGPQEPQK